MRLLLRLVLFCVLAAFLGAAAVVADRALNRGRLFDAALGREGLEAACRPPLLARLRALGFEPDDLAFDDRPSLSVSSITGRDLRAAITFQDGASGTRIDGVVACRQRGSTVSVEVRTTTTPSRAT